MFQNGNDIKVFTQAGHAVLTVVSQRTGKRYTFRVSQAKDRATGEPQQRWFVSLLTGPENTSDYTYMGMITETGDFALTRASKYAADSIPVRAFRFFWHAVNQEAMPQEMTVMHSGHCGRCGRVLTVPSSIETGIGPECAKKIAG